MPGRHRRRWSRAAAVFALASSPLLAVGTAGAADDPPAAGAGVVSGVEGSRAAVVRIEVSATAEIAHIDHSTGDVNVIRGRYEVPIRSASGVFTSSDGVIATTGQALTVTEDDVVVFAANRLFQEEMGTALVGNDGDLARRAEAVDQYWAPHLHHCYDQVEHCVLFFVPQYTVFPHTREPTSTPADLLPVPDGPADVGLLRISGGGGTPTAELAPPDQQLLEQGLLTGFTAPPAAELPPGEMAVAVDPGTAALSSDADVAAALAGGMTGGPVLDPATGEVTGLAATVGGTPTVVPVQRLHEALAAAGTPPAGSEFDAVFRRGVDHLTAGNANASAASAFEESLTYYDSALAAQHLQRAQDTAGAEGAEDATAAGDEGSGGFGTLGLWIGAVGLVLLLLGLAFLLRRRGRRPGHRRPRGTRPGTGGVPTPAALAETAVAERPEPAPVPATRGASAPTAPQPGARSAPAPTYERTQLKQAPAREQSVPPARSAAAFCSDCGDPLRERARFCAACGSPVR
ncbi:zinc ribbon domain-containing protein [Geodermatophilus siccatus]|uniref:zinc ribbon domain-containing protein n=1 Tax=Geodermatophilus siccatus TaxID=1137991 RepID=UPI000B84CB8A|nr:zinc ribbon domain-containing protein [Geodermatophilus siccatus]